MHRLFDFRLRRTGSPRTIAHVFAHLIRVFGQIHRVDLAAHRLFRLAERLSDCHVAVTVTDTVRQNRIVALVPHRAFTVVIRLDRAIFDAEIPTPVLDCTSRAVQHL